MSDLTGGRDPRKQATLVTLAIVLGAGLVWRMYLSPTISSIQTTRDQIRSERLLLERELSLVGRARFLMDGWSVASGTLLAYAPRLFSANDPDRPGSALEAYVRNRAAGVGVDVEFGSVGAMEDDTAGLTRITREAHADTDLEGALALLYAIERGPKLIAVSELDLKRATDEAPLNGSAPEHLVLRMRVEGWSMASREPEGSIVDEDETSVEAR